MANILESVLTYLSPALDPILVWKLRAPQSAAYPLVVARVTETEPFWSLVAPTQLVRSTLCLDARSFAATDDVRAYDVAEQLAEQLRQILDNFTGVLSPYTVESIQRTNLYATPAISAGDGSDRRFFSITSDFSCWHYLNT